MVLFLINSHLLKQINLYLFCLEEFHFFTDNSFINLLETASYPIYVRNEYEIRYEQKIKKLNILSDFTRKTDYV